MELGHTVVLSKGGSVLAWFCLAQWNDFGAESIVLGLWCCAGAVLCREQWGWLLLSQICAFKSHQEQKGVIPFVFKETQKVNTHSAGGNQWSIVINLHSSNSFPSEECGAVTAELAEVQWCCLLLWWLFRLQQQNLCQEGGCEIPWVTAAVKQCLGGVFLFCLPFSHPFDSGMETRREASVGCASKGHLTLCFPPTWHSMTEQSIYLVYLSASFCWLRNDEMLLWICCCLFPLGTCTDLFKVKPAPSKCFIYCSWHLKMTEGNGSRHCTNIICRCLLTSLI